MAGNKVALFLGTNQSPTAAEVTIANLQVSQVGGFSPPINVSQITASDNGFVAVTQGTGNNTGNYVFGPDSSLEFDGGGSAFVVNNIQGLQLTPNSPALQAQTIVHRNFHIAAEAD